MKARINKKNIILISFIFITLGNSTLLINKGLGDLIEYSGLFFLILGIFNNILTKKIKLKTLLRFIVVLFCMSIGILIHNIRIGTKITLLVSVAIIAVLSVLGESYVCSLDEIRCASYGILYGSIIAFIIAILFKESILTIAVEGWIDYGFNCGLQHKNYFGYAMIASISGLLVYGKKEANKKDNIIIFIEIVLVLVSNARSAYIVLGIMLIIANYDMITKIKQKYLFALLVFVSIFACGMLIYNNIALNSTSYIYRYTGFLNYWNYFKNKKFELFFGIADVAFMGDGNMYDHNVRSVVGYNGTLEMAYLNILIKCGLLGWIGLSLIFFHYFKMIKKQKDLIVKGAILTVTVPFIISGITETFISNMHLVYGVYTYLICSGLAGMNNSFVRDGG